MRRISVTAHASDQSELLDRLQRLGTVHVESFPDEFGIPHKEHSPEEAEQAREYSHLISRAEFILELFKENRSEKPGFFESMIPPKYTVDEELFFSFMEHFDINSLYDECFELGKRLIALHDSENALKTEVALLRPWSRYDAPLASINDGSTFKVQTILFPTGKLGEFEELLEENAPASAIGVVNDKGKDSALILLYRAEEADSVRSVLSEFKHKVVSLGQEPESPAERITDHEEELERILAERQEIVSRIDVLIEENISDLHIMVEYLHCMCAGMNVLTRFASTESTVNLTGWISDDDERQTVEELEKLPAGVGLSFEEPGEDEDPPIALRNPRIIRPFEMITRLYGLPNNREYDPTILIAVSFSIFFGFCIGDFGYGLLLMGAFTLIRKKLPLGKTTNDLMIVMTYGAACALLIGAITGSYFGIESEHLPGFLQSIAIFNTLEEPIPFLGVCMAVGLLHMAAGTVVELLDSWRAGDRVSAIIDQGVVLLFVTSLPLAVVMFAVDLSAVGMVLLFAPIAAMVLLFGRSSKKLLGKLGVGLYETYNTVVGWMGDTISYLRLYALGLATFVIGMVVNILAGLIWGSIPVLGILFTLAIILVGHLFNVVINLLGAFVHPLRLEYVEFFGKFYEDGGKAFRPLGLESKTVTIGKTIEPLKEETSV